MPTPEVKEDLPVCTCTKRLLGGQKWGAPHNKHGHVPTGLCGGIHLSKNLHSHLGEGLRTSQSWRKKWDNWPNVHKDPERLSYISDVHRLFITLLIQDAHTPPWVCVSALLLAYCTPHWEGCLCTFSLGVYFCLASVLNKQFLCVLSHMLCCVSNNTLCTFFFFFFTVLPPWNFFDFKSGKRQDHFLSNLALGGLVVRISDFHPGYPGSVPGQGTKISLQDHCCPSEINSYPYNKRKLIRLKIKDFSWTHKRTSHRGKPNPKPQETSKSRELQLTCSWEP